MSSFVLITREEFEDWINQFQKWKRADNRQGVYLIHLSDYVGVKINSTIGSGESTMDHAKASMNLALVSLVTGQTLNKKAQGQDHFKRTKNWRKTWAEGVRRMADAYKENPEFYDAVANIEDREKYKKEMLDLLTSVPETEEIRKYIDRVKNGGILMRKVVERIRAMDKAISNEDDIERLRELWKKARERNDQWTMEFAISIAEALKKGKSLSERQIEVLEDKLRKYRV